MYAVCIITAAKTVSLFFFFFRLTLRPGLFETLGKISSGGGGHCHCSFVARVPLNKNPYIVCTITPGHVHVSKSHRHKQPFTLRSLTLWNPFSRIQPQHLSSSYNSGSLFASVADLEIESIRFLVTSSSELNADVLVILISALVFVPNTVLNKLRVRYFASQMVWNKKGNWPHVIRHIGKIMLMFLKHTFGFTSR